MSKSVPDCANFRKPQKKKSPKKRQDQVFQKRKKDHEDQGERTPTPQMLTKSLRQGELLAFIYRGKTFFLPVSYRTYIDREGNLSGQGRPKT